MPKHQQLSPAVCGPIRPGSGAFKTATTLSQAGRGPPNGPGYVSQAICRAANGPGYGASAPRLRLRLPHCSRQARLPAPHAPAYVSHVVRRNQSARRGVVKT
eukprot:3287908-Rhodomonas_salina.1